VPKYTNPFPPTAQEESAAPTSVFDHNNAPVDVEYAYPAAFPRFKNTIAPVILTAGAPDEYPGRFVRVTGVHAVSFGVKIQSLG
jgi:hypothetical protein